MPGNLGRTSLKRSRRTQNPMRDFDSLPPELRTWLTAAVLPWRASSVQAAYMRALVRTGDSCRALARLDALQAQLVARDTLRVLGESHPGARRGSTTGDDAG